MTAVSISHARENLFPLVRQVNEDHVVVEIVARNGGNAVRSGHAAYPRRTGWSTTSSLT